MPNALVLRPNYEPPTCREATPFMIGGEPEIAPGVRGYAIEHEGRVYIPLILAEREGSGDVGRFLDVLSSRCVIPGVISRRLAGMLRRRGWRETIEADDEDGEAHDVWVHPRAAIGAAA